MFDRTLPPRCDNVEDALDPNVFRRMQHVLRLAAEAPSSFKGPLAKHRSST